ncbi:hypothetical protein KIF59_04190 [Enterobacter cloacae subsp. cloacae]|nr:hypothetical protein [Enterobacter cloacae subsp. cloacae]
MKALSWRSPTRNDKLKGRVEEFAAQLVPALFWNVTLQDESIDGMFAELAKSWDKFDGFVHSIGFALATSWTVTT